MANDHYVPQFYLRNFSPAGARGKIWCYERKKQPRLRGIKSVASEEDFYTLKVDIPFFEKDKLDQMNRVMESDAAPLITRLLTVPKIDLSANEKEKLAMFIACLAVRNPHSQESLMNLDITVRKELMKITAEDKEGFEKHARNLGIDDSPDDLEKLRHEILEFDKHYRVGYERGTEWDDLFLLMGFDSAFKIAPILLDKHWCLLESDSSRVFVTSDNPVVRVRPANYPPQLGLGFLPADILLPLSPKRCLALSNDRPPMELLRAKRERIISANEYIIWNAHRQVFANIRSEDIRKVFEETIEGHNTQVHVA